MAEHVPSAATALRVVRMRRRNRCATIVDIARRVGVSRQRVSRILKDAGEPTAAIRPVKIWQCPVCGKHSMRQFCSQACREAWHRVPLICDECGSVYYRLASRVIKDVADGNRHNFCSRRCHGAWLGRHFGFRLRAINHGWVRQVYLLSGWPSRRVAIYLGLRYATVTDILYKRG